MHKCIRLSHPFYRACVQSCIAFLKAKKWRIVGSQVAVADLARRAGTAIDLLCMDESGTYVVVEVKTRIVGLTRHTDEYKRVNTCKAKTMHGVPNSLYYRHQVQLAKTTRMFQKSKMAQAKRVKAVVLVLVEDQVLEYPLLSSL